MVKKILILICLFTTTIAYANDNNSINKISNDILNGKWTWNINDIVNKLMWLFMNSLKSNLRFVVLIFIVAILSSAILNLKTTFSSDIADTAFYATYVIVAMLGAKGIDIVLSDGLEIINQLNMYTKTVIPTIVSISISSGAIISAAAIQPLIIGISYFITFVITSWLIPMLTTACGMCIVNNMSNRFELSGIIGFVLKSIRWICGILMTVFIGIMTIQCMISPALDSVAGKATRYAIANFIPVVGGLISESITVVAGYASAMKGAVGGAGIIVAITVIIRPLMEIAAITVLYNLVSALMQPVCDKRAVLLMGNFGQISMTLLVLLIMMILMFIINISMAVNIGVVLG